MLNQPSFILIDSLERGVEQSRGRPLRSFFLYRIMAPFWDKTHSASSLVTRQVLQKVPTISVTRLKLNKYFLRWQVDEKSCFWGNYNINIEY